MNIFITIFKKYFFLLIKDNGSLRLKIISYILWEQFKLLPEIRLRTIKIDDVRKIKLITWFKKNEICGQPLHKRTF